MKLQEELADHGMVQSVELPDHLCHILPLLGRMEPHRAAEFARTSVLPAVKKKKMLVKRKSTVVDRFRSNPGGVGTNVRRHGIG